MNKIIESRIDQVWIDKRIEEKVIEQRIIDFKVDSDHKMIVVSIKTNNFEGSLI